MFNFNTGIMGVLFPEVATLALPPYVLIPGIIVIAAIGYLLGSINSAIILSRAIYKEDIRTKGSKNAGMTNMLRNYGLGAAGLTLLGDLMKTVIAVCVAGVVFGFQYVAGISVSNMCYIAGLMAVMGHIFPVYYGFKGGKGVLATASMALVLTPLPFLILLLIFVAIVAVSRYVSLGSVIGAVLYPIILHGFFAVLFESSMPVFAALSTITIAILVVWCHRGNLQRIGNKTESKLSFGKKEKD